MEVIATRIYGADGIELSEAAHKKVELYTKQVVDVLSRLWLLLSLLKLYPFSNMHAFWPEVNDYKKSTRNVDLFPWHPGWTCATI